MSATRLLVVDDRPESRKLLTVRLLHEGYRVQQAENGEQAGTGEVWVCEAVHRELAGRFEQQALPPQDLKDYPQPVAAWRVLPG